MLTGIYKRGPVSEITKNKISKAKTTHGMRKTRIYRIWALMKNRCLNKKDKNYGNYGGRGITIINSWVKFENFWADMKEGYSDSLSIDRIDNSKGYSKENCRWANKITQNNNQRKNVVVEYKGKKITVSQLMRKLNLYTNSGVYYSRIKTGWSIEKTFSVPIQRRNNYV